MERIYKAKKQTAFYFARCAIVDKLAHTISGEISAINAAGLSPFLLTFLD
jgi:hypothetical protein